MALSPFPRQSSQFANPVGGFPNAGNSFNPTNPPGQVQQFWIVSPKPPKPQPYKPPPPSGNGPLQPLQPLPPRPTQPRPFEPPTEQLFDPSENEPPYFCTSHLAEQSDVLLDEITRREGNGFGFRETTLDGDNPDFPLTPAFVNDLGFGYAVQRSSGGGTPGAISSMEINVNYRVRKPFTGEGGTSTTPLPFREGLGYFRCVHADVYGNIFVGTTDHLLVKPKNAGRFLMAKALFGVSQVTSYRFYKEIDNSGLSPTTLVVMGVDGRIYSATMRPGRYWEKLKLVNFKTGRLRNGQFETANRTRAPVNLAAVYGRNMVITTTDGTSLLPNVIRVAGDGSGVRAAPGPELLEIVIQAQVGFVA